MVDPVYGSTVKSPVNWDDTLQYLPHRPGLENPDQAVFFLVRPGHGGF